MKLHLPKQLFTALLAAITLANPAEADTYYLNAADTSTSTDISASFTETSGGEAKATNTNFWKKFCSSQGSYDGPHQLVIDQARTEGNKIKLDFAPFCVTGINVKSGATNNYIYRGNTVDSIIFGNADDGAGEQSSSFAENFTLEHQGSGSIELIGQQTWTITDGKTLTLNGNVKNTGTSTISGGAVSINQYDADSQGNLTNTGTLTIDTALSVAGSITNNGTVTVNSGATLSSNGTFTNDGTLSLGAASHSIGTLTGSGALTVNSGDTAAAALSITSLGSYTGSLEVDKAGTNAATLNVTATAGGNLSGVNVLSGATASFTTTSALTLGAVELSGGSSLSILNSGNQRTTNITSLTVNGSGTLETVRDGACYQGLFNIDSLANEGTSAELTLRNGAKIDNATVFNVNGGTYTGKITLVGNSDADRTANRRMALNLNSSLANAEIVFADTTTTDDDTCSDKENNYIAVGLGAASIEIAGLNGDPTKAATLYGYKIAAGGAFAKDNADTLSGTRTLKLMGSRTYNTNATIKSGINLEKSGEGSQTFTGDLSAFDGSITVEAGTLDLQSSQEMGSAGALSVTSDAKSDTYGTLRVSNDMTAASLSVAAGASASFTGALNTGSITNAGTLSIGTLGDVENTIALNGGSFTVQNWNTSKTHTFSISGENTVTINNVNVAVDHDLEALEGATTHYTHEWQGTDESADGNGYLVQNGDYYLFKGLEWNGTVEGASGVKQVDGNTVVTFSKSGEDEFYIINSAIYDNVSTLGSTGVHIMTGQTLGLNIADGATQTLSTTLAGSGAFEKTGDGTLELNAGNSYTGGTTVTAGKLLVSNSTGLGTGTTTVGSGAILEYAGSEDMTISTLTANSGAEICVSSTGTLTATSFTANGAFSKTGDGTLTVNGAANFGADLTITEGTVNLAGETTFGGTITNAGTLNVTGALTAGAITKTGTGTLILALGENKKKLTDITVNGGTLQITGYDMFNYNSSKTITVNEGGVLQLDARESVNADDTIVLSNGTISGTGGINDKKGYTAGLDMYTETAATPMVIEASGTSTISTGIAMRSSNGRVKFDVGNENAGEGTHELTVSGAIQADGGIIKSGAGELILSGSNTYANGTTIEDGTVTTQNASALGTGGVTMTGGELKVTNVANTDTDLTVGGAIVMNAAATAKLATIGTTLSLGTTGSVKKSNADGSQYVTISSDGDTAASMTARSNDAQLVQLQQDASFTIQDMTLTNTTITAATTTTQVKLQNVTVSDVVLAKGAFTMGETAQVGKGEAGSYDFTTSSLSGITLQNAVVEGVSSSTLVVDLGDLSCVRAMGPGQYHLTITLSGFIMEDYDTPGLLFAADSWLGKLLTAQGATAYVSGGAGGSTGGVSVSYSSTGTGENVGTIIFINGLNVPEPTSTTLGLAALMMLCARRRRND